MSVVYTLLLMFKETQKFHFRASYGVCLLQYVLQNMLQNYVAKHHFSLGASFLNKIILLKLETGQ